jgi:hypothetical protein
MAQHQSLSVADATRLFEGLTGGLARSAKELKDGHRAWMKVHHPDITGRHDPLSLEAVQWMNAAYDVLKAQDWTKTRREQNHTDTTADAEPAWTDVGGSSRSYADESRWREEQLRRWREQQEEERREKEEEHRRRAEAVKRRNEALKKVLFGSNFYGAMRAAYVVMMDSATLVFCGAVGVYLFL